MSLRARRRGPLRIAHVVRSLEVGGQEIVLTRLVTALDPDRYACTVVTLMDAGQSGPLGARLRGEGIPVVSLGAREGVQPALVAGLAGLAWKLDVDVLHTHNFQPFLYAGLASYARPRARLIATAHGFRAWRGWRFPQVTRALFRRASAIVAVTPELSGYLRERGVPRETVRVIVNGVDTEVFRPAAEGSSERDAARAVLGIAEHERVIGFVGRLSPEKDPENLVRAMDRVLAKEPRARLVMAGDGPLRQDLELLVRARGLEGRARLIGEHADVRGFLSALDVFCLPSQTEGTSISLLEAMSCALPIVATAVGGTPAVVGGDAAVLVPPADPGALGEAIAGALADPAGAKAMGARARSVAERRFGLRRMAEGYAALYDAICAG